MCPLFLGHKPGHAKVVFEITQRLFHRSPAKFEFSQSLVRQGGPAKIQDLGAAANKPSNAFPHCQVAAAQVLESLIGCAEFVYGAIPAAKIEISGNGQALVEG